MTPTSAAWVYFAAGLIAGLARVYRYYGLSGFKTPKLTIDAIFSAAGGVLYPYLVPTLVTDRVPVIAIAFGIAAMTYAVNHFFIKMLKRLFGYQEPSKSGGTP